jgi:hypothetical protein
MPFFLDVRTIIPFRIVLDSGKTYDVQHPDFIEVGRDVFIYYHRPSKADERLRRTVTISVAVNQ